MPAFFGFFVVAAGLVAAIVPPPAGTAAAHPPLGLIPGSSLPEVPGREAGWHTRRDRRNLRNRTGTRAGAGDDDDDDLKVTEEFYETMRLKGCNLMQAMAKTDAEAAWWVGKTGSAESAFQKLEDLAAWGYTPYAVEDFRYSAPAYDDAYEAMGLDPDKDLGGGDKGPNKAIAFKHAVKTTHADIEYRPTGAFFQTIINTEDGVIMAWLSYGAQHMAQAQKPPVAVFPKLKNWSDIAFLSWRSQGGGSGLKYIWRSTISNEVTSALIGWVLSEHPKGRREVDKTTPFESDECENYGWEERVEFSTTEAQGLVLLGSPNGRGAGFLLLEHKATFGDKTTISKVTFSCSGDEEQNLIFHVNASGN